jgi:hypothetical protein
MIAELIVAGSFVGLKYVYHRWLEVKPRPPTEKRIFEIPKIEEGAPVPLIYGKCRVRTGVLAWAGPPSFASGAWQMNQFYVVGIPFQDGNGTSQLHRIWLGERRFLWSPSAPTGPAPAFAETLIGTGPIGLNLGGIVQYMTGASTQEFVNSSAVAQNLIASAMLAAGVAADEVPGYRGYFSVGLTAPSGGASKWVVGDSAGVPAVSFEVSSYPSSTSYPSIGLYQTLGDSGANPIDVIYDLLVAKLGKLGLSSSYIDTTSFQAAAYTVRNEGNGYSNAINSAQEADEHIQDVLRQVDGALDEDPSDGLIKIKLVRDDYVYADLPHITKDNCEAIKSFAISGWTNIVNAVRVKYRNRDKDYTEDSEVEFNQGNAVGQDQLNEDVIDYPAVTTSAVAKNLAKRELGARSRPMIKMVAVIDRSFLRVLRGHAVKVTWTNPDIAGLVFRVADVNRGTLEDGKIELSLLLDSYYVWRAQAPKPPFEPNLPDWIF